LDGSGHDIRHGRQDTLSGRAIRQGDSKPKPNAWTNLTALSDNTALSCIEAHPAGVYQMGNDQFEAVATVYLTLNKGQSNAFTNSLPAHVVGRLGDNNTVEIEKITVDSSSLDPSGPSQMGYFRTL
jgi:hypothetical protein